MDRLGGRALRPHDKLYACTKWTWGGGGGRGSPDIFLSEFTEVNFGQTFLQKSHDLDILDLLDLLVQALDLQI